MIYLLHPSLPWKAFKKINDAINKINKETGPYPKHLDKVLWQMLKEKKIYLWIENDQMIISLKPPKGKARMIKGVKR
jgi:hypothetical protein